MGMNEQTEKRLFLIDSYGYLFRAYHSLPPLTNPEGVPVGAVYGFTNMMIKLKNKVSTNNAENIFLIAVFDSGKKTFRNEIYADYKANRPEAPEDLKPQFPLIRDVVSALNIEAVESIGYEADDIIATFAKKAEENNFKVTIVSTDKDLMQLVNDNISLYDPMRDRIIGINEVKEKFGVTPDKVLDVLSLMGDSSDNIPGVPGIGPKTAAELINEYGDTDQLINNLDKIKQDKRRTTLKENIENIYLSKKLASLDMSVPVDLDFNKYKIKENDKDNLVTFLAKHNFKSLVAKYSDAKNNATSEVKIEKVITEENKNRKIITINSAEELNDLFTKNKNANISIYYDFNCSNLLSLNFNNDTLCVLNITDSSVKKKDNSGDLFTYADNKDDNQVDNIIKNEYTNIIENYFGQDNYNFVFYDLKNLLKANIFSKTPNSFDDIKILAYLLSDSESSLKFEQISNRYLQRPISEITVDNSESEVKLNDLNIILFDLFDKLKHQLFIQKQNYIYSEIELPLVPILFHMESVGIKIDRYILSELEKEFNLKIINLSKEIFALANSENDGFNIGSPKQLGEILFDKLNLPAPKKTKTGQYLTDSETLENLSLKGFTIADKILEWRMLSKLISTYIISLQKEADRKSDRVHTTFNNTATATGRLSSINPNLQNIPIRTEEGRRIRTAFIAEKGNVLIGADYSQIELRLLAHMADIPVLKDAFKNGKDIHSITASEVFGVPLDQITPELRRQAKTVNFGIIYGQSAFGLAKQLGISNTEAKNIIDRYFARYSGIKKYMENTIIFAREHGYVETLFGRRINLPGINDKNHARRNFQERAAINAPLQGTAADIIKKAMVSLVASLPSCVVALQEKNNHATTQPYNHATLLLQIHDELIFECPSEKAEENCKIIKNIMENSANLSVPLLVDIKHGKNWGEVH